MNLLESQSVWITFMIEKCWCKTTWKSNLKIMQFFFFSVSVLFCSSTYKQTHIISPVDGQWSGWTPWGQCSVSCGAGLQSRYRFCSSPQRSGSGLPCLGPHREDQVCISTPCDREFVYFSFVLIDILLIFKCIGNASSTPHLFIWPAHGPQVVKTMWAILICSGISHLLGAF